MKLYVWNYVDDVTGAYHDGGGVVVIAEDLKRARELISQTKTSGNPARDRPCEAMEVEPDLVRECEGPEFIALHPDAGCC